MFNPVLDYLRVVFKNGIDFKYLLRAHLYLFKFVFFEPFRLYEKMFLEKKINEHVMAQPPIFILGYYRSGTTHLQELILQDTRFAYMNFYQCFFSNAFNSTEKIFIKGFNFFVKIIKMKHPAHKIPFQFDLPGEEDVALVSSGFRLAPNWGQVFPRAFKNFFEQTVFFKNLSEKDYQLFSLEYLRLIKRLSIAHGNKRLLLKSPPNTARIRFLLNLFPDAKFIFIHRDPVEQFKSNQKLWSSFHGQCLQDFDAQLADESILWSMNLCFEKYQIEKKLLNPNQLSEVSYEELLSSPLQVIQNIYKELELEGYEHVKPNFEKYIKTNHGNNLTHHLTTQEELITVRNRLLPWIERWGHGIS